MINLGPLAGAVGVAGLIFAAGAAMTPAFAGPAETALLKSYEGNWRGSGPLIGGDQENVTCRMSLSDGNDDKVNYNGRCALAGANLSINGTLAYIDENHRYEGAMTSNVNFSGVAIGQKRGDGIVFNLVSRGMDEGKTIEVTAGITLTPGVITVDFKARDLKSGKTVTARVPFSRT
jgi:hypothetical protein